MRLLLSSFLQKQALKDSLQNSCSKQLFGIVLGRPASVLHRGCFVGKYAGIFGAVFFKTPVDVCFRKFKQPLSRRPMDAFWWVDINLRELSICSKVVLIPKLSTGKNKNAIFFRKTSECKNKVFTMPIPMTMMMLRFQKGLLKRQGFASKLIVLTVNLLNIFSVKHIAKQHLECLK